MVLNPNQCKMVAKRIQNHTGVLTSVWFCIRVCILIRLNFINLAKPKNPGSGERVKDGVQNHTDVSMVTFDLFM